MKKTFRLVTLGCRTNQYESEAYRSQLQNGGFSEAVEGESAALCVVNTCTVTASADGSSRREIRKLVRENPGAKVVVTGCLVDNSRSLDKEIEGITLVPNSRKEQLLEEIFPEEYFSDFSLHQFGGHTRAFVKVQDGCNSFCSYCIIPYVRGRSHSRKIVSIVEEIQRLVTEGYKEVVITGINVGDFDGGGEHNLAELIRTVDSIEGLERLRLSSIDPDEVDEELMGAILEGKKTCPSMHIVLQAGSNGILKRMRRKYTRHCFLETVEKLKKHNSDFTFTTDVIVGFPGESEEDFEETLAVIREVQFAKVHMFPFSRRERTKAASFPNQIAPEIIQERKQRVLRLSESVAYTLREKFLDRKMGVLLENEEKEGYIFGHTDNFLPVWIPKKQHLPNTVLKVHLRENAPQGFIGTFCEV